MSEELWQKVLDVFAYQPQCQVPLSCGFTRL